MEGHSEVWNNMMPCNMNTQQFSNFPVKNKMQENGGIQSSVSTGSS